MIHEKLYDSLIATPVSAEDAVAGDIAWAVFRGMVSGTLMMVVAMVMGVFPASVPAVLLSFVLMVFVGVLFGSLAMIVTSVAPNFDFFNYYTELVLTPMLFFSGVFFPLEQFPGLDEVVLPVPPADPRGQDIAGGLFRRLFLRADPRLRSSSSSWRSSPSPSASS